MKKISILIVALVIVALAVFVAVGLDGNQAGAFPGSAGFTSSCKACHGANGPIGPFQSRNEKPTTEAVLKQLRTPKANMPTFNAAFVTDADAAQIADFLATEFKAPAALPRSGEPAVPFAALAGLGAFLVAGGYALRRISRARN